MPTGGRGGPWFACLPSCETGVPCGTGRHTVRWEAGSLRLASHPDAEGELVLAALGGEKARCLELAEAWARHTSDLSVLAIWPRGPEDEITVGWDDVLAAAQAGFGPRPAPAPGLIGPPQSGPLAGPPAGPSARAPQSGPRAGPAAWVAARQQQHDILAAQRRRDDLLSLLALGYGFQVRLVGQVAAAHAAAGGEQARPALVAAIAGRLAPVAERWLGIDPDQVIVTLHHGPGWGSAELTGRESGRRLRVSLPGRVAGLGLGLRARADRTAPGGGGGTAGLAARPGARAACPGRRARAAGRARRPGSSWECPTLGGMIQPWSAGELGNVGERDNTI